jgi:hypothetical protein
MQLGLAAHWQLRQDLPTNHPRIVTRQVRSVLGYGACKYVRIVYIVLCAPNPLCKAFFVQGKPFTRSVARMQAAGRNPGDRRNNLPGLRCASSGLQARAWLLPERSNVARMQAAGRNPGDRRNNLPGLRCASSGLQARAWLLPEFSNVARMQAEGRNPGRSAKGTTSNCEGQPCDGLCQVDAFPGWYLTPFA